MNISQKQVLNLIQRSEIYNLYDVAFILTVLRDNCLDDDLHRYIDILLAELYKKR